MLLVQVHEFRTYTKYVLEILRKCGKSIETKSQKVWWLILLFVKVTGGKMVESFLVPHHPKKE